MLAESFNNLNEKYKMVVNDSSPISNSDNSKLDIAYDFDELKMYFGDDYWVTDKICITQPTIGDILEFGDTKFYSILNLFCSNPTSLRLQLWRMGIDWNKISDFELFSQIIVHNFTPKDTYLLFGNLNFSWFEYVHDNKKDCNLLIYIPRNENGEMISVDYNDAIVIDEFIYTKIVKYLCLMFNLHFKIELAKNKATKEAMIWEDEMNLNAENEKRKKMECSKSFLLPLISAMVNHPGFKYKTNELKEIGIVQFMDSVKRLQIYENSTALLKGMYSGFIDISKDKNLQKQINWLKDLNE